MISDNYVPLRQLGNGATTAFSSNWNVLAASYIRVYLENVTTGVQVPQTLGVDFTLVFTDAGFTVTFAVAPSASNYVVIGRAVALDQTDPYRTSRGFQGEVVEASFDKLTAAVQDINDGLDRSLQFPLGDTGTGPLPTVIARKGLALLFDPITGVPYAGAIASGIGVSSAMTPVVQAATLALGRTAFGLGSAAVLNTGTSGANIPLLNGTNTWGGIQTISAPSSTPFVVNNSNGGATSVFQQFLAASASLGYLGANTANCLLALEATGNNTRFNVDQFGQGNFVAGCGFGNAANTNTNVLDHYEEGTFTPTWVGGTVPGTTVYSTQFGRFIRVGKLVFFQIALITTSGTGTGQPVIAGFPYPNSANFIPQYFYNNGKTGAAGNVQQPLMGQSSSQMTINQYVQTTGAQVGGTFNGVVELYIAGFYMVT